MSQVIRQASIFAAEDFTKIYKSFQDIDFTAYDFDTIKQALITYLRAHYPEDFNDYIESSEFIAIVELLAYLGTSLAFRSDLNARENIMDTATRRESIIRLARLINYQPKRNIAASGLFKISSIRTDQPLTDSVGESITNTPVFWADPNNPDWFDQFITILNNALNPTNPFGRPSKSGTIGNIPTDGYEMNNVLGLDITQSVTINVNGEQIPIDITNPDFVSGETFFEQHPDPSNPFNLIYRNDSLGVGSNNTGFFLYFKQGTLTKLDYRYDFPLPSRVENVPAIDINQTDVYVQEIDNNGIVQAKWTKVPSVNGTNVIYNSINHQDRNIFEVISELNDGISVKFPDGNFGDVPTGIFRYWFRNSIGRNIIIRPEDAEGLQFTLPYNGPDGQLYNLVISFNLLYSVSNGAAAETDTQVKLRAPQTYFTQERMINHEDYNVFPLVFGNQITKVRAINRTHAGHSRYIDINDPTGFHQNLNVLGEDGALYNDLENQRSVVNVSSEIIGDISQEVLIQLQVFMQNQELQNFYYNEYIQNMTNIFGSAYFSLTTESTFWKTSPDTIKNNKGFFILDNDEDTIINWPYGASFNNVKLLTDKPYSFIRPGAIVEMTDADGKGTIASAVNTVIGNGRPLDPSITLNGPVTFGSEIADEKIPALVTPAFRTVFNENDPVVTTGGILDKIASRQDFGLGYDVNNDIWYVIDTPNEDGLFELTLDESDSTQISKNIENDPGWLVFIKYAEGDSSSNPHGYEFISRGTVTIFESLDQVRFYWEPDQKLFDVNTGRSLQDSIEILPNINNTVFFRDCNGNPCDPESEEGICTSVPLESALVFFLTGKFIYEDGFTDTAKIEVSPADTNEDGTPDIPLAFKLLVSNTSEVLFEKYTDINGYERSRPWSVAQDNSLINYNWDRLGIFIKPDADGLATADEMGFTGLTGPDDSSLDVDIEVPLSAAGLFMFKEGDGGDSSGIADGIPDSIARIARLVETAIGTLATTNNATIFASILINKVLREGNIGTFIGQGVYWKIELRTVGSKISLVPVPDNNHSGKNGVSFGQDLNIPETDRVKLIYKWRHYAPTDQRIDPSVSNIIDMIVLTDAYFNSILIWKDERGSELTYPPAPTTEELRIEFGELNKFKSISDEIIFNSGKFKILFGDNAEPELQATFKAVKIISATISDNELKTRIIQNIDEYFSINNWDFGEKFYYTELAAFIHTRLSKFLSSVVIVPDKEESEFGNLFEIVASPDELFLSTATVENVEIVNNYTETNLRL